MLTSLVSWIFHYIVVESVTLTQEAKARKACK